MWKAEARGHAASVGYPGWLLGGHFFSGPGDMVRCLTSDCLLHTLPSWSVGSTKLSADTVSAFRHA
jgi:hypothetical protein